MIIRIATKNDIAIIKSIAELTWPDSYLHIIGQQQINYMLNWMYSEETLANQMQQGHVFFIASYTNTDIGFAGISNEGNGIFKLNKLYVLPQTQKTGAGKLLLKTVIDHAKNNNGKQIQLQVNRANNAKSFYEKNGFYILSEADFDIGNGYFMNDYVMALNI